MFDEDVASGIGKGMEPIGGQHAALYMMKTRGKEKDRVRQDGWVEGGTSCWRRSSWEPRYL